MEMFKVGMTGTLMSMPHILHTISQTAAHEVWLIRFEEKKQTLCKVTLIVISGTFLNEMGTIFVQGISKVLTI